ncbi:hypothetical protein PV721_24275 [Streptomyces sp. MB09-01]|uniref:hypothetical protein n=1 Tax=Streptomyces sp. MB09-01 TaxID=3028666 RepID=UPI00299FBDBC|nr:hypothetical protein [Streptomyces sp. MB09-01]MDX3537429.1 hypothetical protein [Streptomyces sp. MB09-01]
MGLMMCCRGLPRLLATSGLLTALTLTGCSSTGSGADDDGREPEAGAAPRILNSAELTLPLDAYILRGERVTLLTRAQNTLVDQCMKRYGFRYTGQGGDRVLNDRARLYGITDADQAARYGYSNPDLASGGGERPAPATQLGPNESLFLHGEKEVDPSKPVPMSQEEAEQTGQGAITVDGQKVPAGGCRRESYLKLYAPTKDAVDIMLPQNMATDSYLRAGEDSRVRKVTAEWSACMAEKGYKTDDPVSPQEDLGFQSAPGSPQAIAAAQHDVACKERTNLVGVWHTVQTAYQKRVIEKNAETLDLAKKQMEDRLRLAAQLTGTG